MRGQGGESAGCWVRRRDSGSVLEPGARPEAPNVYITSSLGVCGAKEEAGRGVCRVVGEEERLRQRARAQSTAWGTQRLQRLEPGSVWGAEGGGRAGSVQGGG